MCYQFPWDNQFVIHNACSEQVVLGALDVGILNLQCIFVKAGKIMVIALDTIDKNFFLFPGSSRWKGSKGGYGKLKMG